MNVSIIISTRNRAAFLQRTLDALRLLVVPDGLEAELLIVDNASADETATIVSSARLNRISVRRIVEPEPGKSRSQNRGLAESRGDLILFTDDDVHPPPDWIDAMCRPLIDHGPCGVAGGVRLAPSLLRPWMTSLHRSWLASTEWLDPVNPRGMVGANMAFSREILRRVPGFDVELGPGALGFGDEQLFASQLLESGFRIVPRLDACVEHHFDPIRLSRTAWLNAARKRGRSQAYRGHHWEHWGSRYVRPRLLAAHARLFAWRLSQRETPSAEGCTQMELNLEFQCALLHGHLRERQRPRNYDYRGPDRRRVLPTPTLAVSSPLQPAS